MRPFDLETVVALVRLSRAVRDDHSRRIQAALGALAAGFFAPLLAPGRHAILSDRAVAMAEPVALERTLLRMRLPGRLTFLFRIRFGLYAVLARIGAELDGPYASPGRPLFAGSSDFRNVT